MPLPLPKIASLVEPPLPPPRKQPLWERPITTVLKGAAGLTDGLARPLVRASDAIIQNAAKAAPPPRPQPKGWAQAWDRAMEILNTPTAELERAAVEQGPNHSRQLLPAARAVNTVARKTLTVADTVKHDMRGLSESAPEKLAAKALEEAPSLLLTGPSTGMKLANAATGMVLAYGKHGMAPAAIAAGVVPGNSAASNAA